MWYIETAQYKKTTQRNRTQMCIVQILTMERRGKSRAMGKPQVSKIATNTNALDQNMSYSNKQVQHVLWRRWKAWWRHLVNKSKVRPPLQSLSMVAPSGESKCCCCCCC